MLETTSSFWPVECDCACQFAAPRVHALLAGGGAFVYGFIGLGRNIGKNLLAELNAEQRQNVRIDAMLSAVTVCMNDELV